MPMPVYKLPPCGASDCVVMAAAYTCAKIGNGYACIVFNSTGAFQLHLRPADKSKVISAACLAIVGSYVAHNDGEIVAGRESVFKI